MEGQGRQAVGLLNEPPGPGRHDLLGLPFQGIAAGQQDPDLRVDPFQLLKSFGAPPIQTCSWYRPIIPRGLRMVRTGCDEARGFCLFYQEMRKNPLRQTI